MAFTLASLRSRDAASRRREPEVNFLYLVNSACVCLKIGALCFGDAEIFAKFTASSISLKFFAVYSGFCFGNLKNGARNSNYNHQVSIGQYKFHNIEFYGRWCF